MGPGCRGCGWALESYGVTPPHRTPDVWAENLGMHPYWRIVLITIRAP